MKYRLEISAQLENISFLRPYGGVDTDKMPYFFKMLCENCGEVTSEQCTYLNQKVYLEGKEYNHCVKCKECDRIGTVKLITGSGRDYTIDDSGAYTPLMVFDVDGLQIHKYVFNGGWEIEPVFGEPIKINLVNGGFVGVGESPPIVNELNSRFVRI